MVFTSIQYLELSINTSIQNDHSLHNEWRMLHGIIRKQLTSRARYEGRTVEKSWIFCNNVLALLERRRTLRSLRDKRMGTSDMNSTPPATTTSYAPAAISPTPERSNHYFFFNVYWTVHHLDSWIKRDQLDVTCFIISLFNAQHISDVNTSILRSLRLIWWVIAWVVLFWFDVCWCYVVVVINPQPPHSTWTDH